MSCLSPTARSLLKVHLALFLSQLSFSSINVFGKVAMKQGLGPIPLVSFRMWGSIPFFMLGSLLLEKDSLQSLMEDSKLRLRTFLQLSLFMGTTTTVSQICYLYGLSLSTPTNGATLHLAIPVWTTLIAILFKKETASVLKIIGILITLGGAVGMLELEALNFENAMLVGNILILVMTFLFSIYLVFTKQMSTGLGPFTTTTIMFGTSGLQVLVAFPIPQIWKEYTSILSSEGWVAIGLTVIFGTLIPYLFINWTLKNSSAVLVSIYTPMELVGTVILSAIVLNDFVTWRQGVGIGGILTGLLLVTIDKYREQKKLDQQKEDEEQNRVMEDDEEVEIKEKEPLVKEVSDKL